jgi:hypothetical protein
MRPAGSANVRVATRSEGDETFVTVTALDDAGEPVNFGVVRGTVAHDDGREIASQGLSLRQTGPGRYEGSFESGESGSYLMSLRYDAAGGSGDSGTVTASVERPFADEFRARGANRGLLERVASVTGGRVLSLDGGGVELFSRAGLEKPVALTPVWLWLALGAVGLFLADVAIRRVRLSGASIAAWVRGFARRAERAGEGGVGSLRAARAAAAARVGAGESGGRSDAKAERAAARAEATRAREVASRKYEADESRRGKGAGAVVTPAGGGDGEGRVARSGDGRGGGGDGGARDGGGDADSGAGGMSRLMAAKRRARGERMSETGDDG